MAVNTHPGHDTLATFRKRFLPALEALFVLVLSIAQTKKLFRLGQITLDSSKPKANAPKHKALYHGNLEKLEAQRQAGKPPRGQESPPPKAGPRAQDQVEPMLDALAALPDSLGQVDSAAMDNGYCGAANVKTCPDILPLIAWVRDAYHMPLAERFGPDAPEPQTGVPVVRMAWRVKTKAGRTRHAKRKATVEPVFGIIKHVLGFRQRSLRGLVAVAGEWTIVTLAFNLKQMHVPNLA